LVVRLFSWARLFGAVVAVGVCLVFTAEASASPGALKILLTDSGTLPTTLQSQLEALPGVATVDTFNTGAGTPTDAQLDAYDVVVVLSDNGLDDPTTMGNNLADYQDQGGVVVGGEFLWQDTGNVYDLAGRWMTAGYSPFAPGSRDFGSWSLGTYDTTSPLLAGVSTLTATYVDDVTLASGATQLGVWSGGPPAIAVKGNAVGINAYFGNEACSPASSCWTGDYARIIVNAGNVLGRHTLTVFKGGTGAGTVTSVPAGINCGATCAFNYANGTPVTLTATPSPGSTFAGWSGAGCSGTATCTVTMNAAQAVSATFTMPAPPNTTAPHISGASLGAKSFKAKKGTTLKLTLSSAASVKVVITHIVSGHKVRGVCKAHASKGKKCTINKKVKTLHFSGATGANRFKLLIKSLKPGSYTAKIAASNSTGTSNAVTLKFKIITVKIKK
jgi:hypothetical protein